MKKEEFNIVEQHSNYTSDIYYQCPALPLRKVREYKSFRNGRLTYESYTIYEDGEEQFSLTAYHRADGTNEYEMCEIGNEEGTFELAEVDYQEAVSKIWGWGL